MIELIVFLAFGLILFFFGFEFISTSMACSKLNGWSETGLAFGMINLLKARMIVCSPLCTASEHASTASCSALRHDISKNVRILAVIVVRKTKAPRR